MDQHQIALFMCALSLKVLRLFEKIEALNLEGMVMKRKDSVYAFARCRDWLKVRTTSGRVAIQKRIENWK